MERIAGISRSSKEQWLSILGQPHLLCILCLGFGSGLPLLLTGSTLQAWYAVSHVDIVTIGVLTLVGQPYVYKFLWSPLMDRYHLPWLDRRRGWILLTQILLIAGIALMGTMTPDHQPVMLGMLALVVASFSASQDIAIDAYRTELLQPAERGLGAGLNTIGYRLAMVVAGAFALVLADEMGWKVTYWIMAGLMSTQLIVTYFAPTIRQEQAPPPNLLKALVEPFSQFLKQRYSLTILLFIIIYKLGDVFTLVLGTTFLIRGIGFSLTDIGLMYKLVGMLGIFVGVIVGGMWMKRIPLLRALIIFGIIQTMANLPFMFLAMAGKNYYLLVITIFLENFGSGLGSVAFLAFIMALCDHRYTATQFALFSALAAVGRVFVGPIAGVMVEHLGWVQYYLYAFLIGFPGIFLLSFIKRHTVFNPAVL